MGFVYFLYSDEQIEEKNKVLAGMSKTFQPGIISIGNVKKKFTQISSEPTIPRFVDTKVIASGEQSSFTYTLPQSIEIRGNS